jgi:hypothetical protein
VGVRVLVAGAARGVPVPAPGEAITVTAGRGVPTVGLGVPGPGVGVADGRGVGDRSASKGEIGFTSVGRGDAVLAGGDSALAVGGRRLKTMRLAAPRQ